MKVSSCISLLFLSTVSSFSPSKLNLHLNSNVAGHGFRTQKQSGCDRVTIVLLAGKVGVFFGTSTGATEGVADMICSEFDVEAVEIDGIQGSVAKKFAEYDALIVGTPTWNTGADVERSGTGWDEIYYGEMQGKELNIQCSSLQNNCKLNDAVSRSINNKIDSHAFVSLLHTDLHIAGKKVAVFGLGDQISYSENYADASGEVS